MRVLIIQTSPLAELLQSLPVTSDLRREFPQLAVDWCVDEAFAGLLRLHSGVDRILPAALPRWRQKLLSTTIWREIRQFRRALRAVDYEAIFDLSGSLGSALLARQACGTTCGYETAKVPHLLLPRLYDARYLIPAVTHPVERHRWLIAAALELPLEMPIEYGLSAPPLVADWLPKQPYVLLEPDPGFEDPYWVALGKALESQGYAIILGAGHAEEHAHAAALARAIPAAVLAPPLDIGALAGLLTGAAGIIGKISPILHLAAALQRPAVCLHPHSDTPNDGILSAAPFRNLGGQGTIPDVAAVLNAFLTCTRP